MEAFAKRLRDLREERQLGQVALAKAIGVSSGAISFWENEIREPTATNLLALAEYFGVTVDYLLGKE